MTTRSFSPAAKAKRTLLAIEIPRDELALRIAQGCLGMGVAPGTDATAALDVMDTVPLPDPTAPPMGEGFRRAADQAIAYVHERINAGRQPS